MHIKTKLAANFPASLDDEVIDFLLEINKLNQNKYVGNKKLLTNEENIDLVAEKK